MRNSEQWTKGKNI